MTNLEMTVTHLINISLLQSRDNSDGPLNEDINMNIDKNPVCSSYTYLHCLKHWLTVLSSIINLFSANPGSVMVGKKRISMRITNSQISYY